MKMKSFVLLMLCLFFAASGCGGETDSADSGPFTFAVGYCTDSSGIQIAGYWKNGVWTALPSLSADKDSCAEVIAVSGSDIYIGGYSTDSAGTKCAGYWKNRIWTALAESAGTTGSEISALIISNGIVHAAGIISNSSGTHASGWADNTPANLSGTSFSYSNSMATDGTSFYIGGGYTASTAEAPGYWKDGTWNGLTPIDTAKPSEVYSITVSGTAVVAGGFSTDTDGVKRPVYWNWNGTPITVLTNISGNEDGAVCGIAVSGNDIYACGYGIISGIRRAMSWKNLSMGTYPAIDSGKNSSALSLHINGTDIYAAGYSENSSAVRVAGYWKNGTWTGLTSPVPSRNAAVYDLKVISQ